MNHRQQAPRPTVAGCPWPPDNWVHEHTPALHTDTCIWCDWPTGNEGG